MSNKNKILYSLAFVILALIWFLQDSPTKPGQGGNTDQTQLATPQQSSIDPDSDYDQEIFTHDEAAPAPPPSLDPDSPESRFVSIKEDGSGITLKSEPLKKLKHADFLQVMDDLDSYYSDQSAENTRKYTDLLIAADNGVKPFTLEQVQCGDLVCFAGLTYLGAEDLDWLKDHLMHNPELDSHAAVFLTGEGYSDSNYLGLVFTAGTVDAGISKPLDKNSENSDNKANPDDDQ